MNYRIELLCEHLREHGIEIKDKNEHWKEKDFYYQHVQSMVAVGRELEFFIPPGLTYIIIDMNKWGPGQLLEHSFLTPFLEKDGIYWGAPSDDAMAIQEFERLYHAAKSFIVFGSPAFWWFDYSTEFNCYLRRKFPCVLENERFVVFDRRPNVG